MARAVTEGWTEEAPDVDLDPHTPDMGDGDETLEGGHGEGIVREGEEADQNYEQLLGRVFRSLGENYPDLARRRSRAIFRPPNVLREAPKKRVFVNFMDACERMRRQPKHVMDFLLSEMRTSGSLDGQQRLVVQGRFTPRDFEAPLRRYTREYVVCNACKLPDTTLPLEKRLLFLRCDQCGFSRSVAPVKARFFPEVDRRWA